MKRKEDVEIREIVFNREPEEERPPKKKGRSLWSRIFSVLLILLLALGGLWLVVHRGQVNLDGIRRQIAYLTVHKDDSGQAREITYEKNAKTRCAAFDGGLLAVSPRRLQVFTASGKESLSLNVSLEEPAIFTQGDRAVIYDVGGDSLYVISSEKVLLDWKPEQGKDAVLLSARLNSSGWLAVTSRENGWRGVVTVYNSKMEKVYDWFSSSRFVTDAEVLPDCKRMAAATVEQEEAVFISRINFFRLGEDKEYASCPLEDGLILSVGGMNGTVAAVSERSLLFSDPDGKQTGSFDYSDRYLGEFSLDGDGFVTLALNKYKAGSQARLVTVNTKGETLGSLNISDEVLSLSAAGKYVAVLYADRLTIYTSALETYAELDGTDSARGVLMRTDGTALLTGDGSARLYIP